MAMTYSQLQTAVQDAVENTFSTTDFATMTQLAEQRIYNSVQLPNLRKTSTLATVSGNAVLTLPADFLSAFSFAVVSSGEYFYLLQKDPEFLREAYPSPTVTGVPRYYAMDGTQAGDAKLLSVTLAPTPNAVFSVVTSYYHQPESIVTAGSTWLGDNFESVLFNAVMVEAARWMKEEADIVAAMDKEYQQSLALLKNLADGKAKTDAYRSGLVRNKVL